MSMFWLWIKAVGKHWKRELLGGALIGLLALFSELSGITVAPRIYEASAVIVLFHAMFLAWRDQAEALETEHTKKEKEPISEGKLFKSLLDPTLITQNRLPAALERQVEHEGRTRVSRMLHRPGPTIGVQEACESNQARLFVQNNGATAEFYGVFTVKGLTDADLGETFYCKWQHTYSKCTKIPKGLGFWILLATRNTDSFGFSRWEINAVKESEH
jgi:hypothetical protein